MLVLLDYSKLLSGLGAIELDTGQHISAGLARRLACQARPVGWCEAHHDQTSWAAGGGTSVSRGRLLCAFHHGKAHSPHYDMTRLPTGGVPSIAGRDARSGQGAVR